MTIRLLQRTKSGYIWIVVLNEVQTFFCGSPSSAFWLVARLLAGMAPGRPEDGTPDGISGEFFAETKIRACDHGYRVEFRDLWEECGADEALWCVFQQMNGEPGRYLRSQAEHDEWDRRYRCQRDPTADLEEWQKLLPTV